MANACGMDFGTSNSTVGWRQPGRSTLLTLEDGKPTLPSVIFFNADEEVVHFGRAALADYLSGSEGRLMRSMKSLLGTPLIDSQTEVLGSALPFRSLLAQFLGELKRRAQHDAQCSFNAVVIGRPVHFIDDDAVADRLAQTTLEDIVRTTGFAHVQFQFEPIAAAFDYESTITKEELVLVVDVGGGTTDFSLIRLSPDRAKKPDRRSDILASAGVHIGGTDFDKYLSLSSVMPLFGMGSCLKNGSEVPSSYYFNLATWHTINLAYTQKIWTQLQEVTHDAVERDKLERLLDLVKQRAGHWLAMQVEAGKIGLSDAPEYALQLERIANLSTIDLSRTQFDKAIEPLITRIGETVSLLLADANISANAVNTIFFTGGSSGIPLLRAQISALLPETRSVEGDRFGSIGAGLALDAVRKFG